jgi:tetratricopeptide (TPR) repeat protein
LWLRAVSRASEFTEDSMAAALQDLERALDIDPGYALAMASAAYYHAQRHFQGWEQQEEEVRIKATRMAWSAVELDRDDVNVLWQSAFAIWTLDRNGPKALELFRRALQINPNSAIALAMAGWVEAVNGNPEAGRRMIERSQRLNPCHPRAWFVMTGMSIAYLADGKFQEAIDWAEKALVQNRRFAIALRALAVALVNIGQIERARQIVQELLEIEPKLMVSGLSTRLPFVQQPILKTYRDALREAGLPA